jgi:hypothetical protein
MIPICSSSVVLKRASVLAQWLQLYIVFTCAGDVMYFVKNGELEVRFSTSRESIDILSTASNRFAQRAYACTAAGEDIFSSTILRQRSYEKKHTLVHFLARVLFQH